MFRTRVAAAVVTLAAALVVAPSARAQVPPAPIAPVAAASDSTPHDALGRDTPRGALLGFITAARKGQLNVASLYLRTPARGAAAIELARQLYVVLDARLPARLDQVSDDPAGSRINPLTPNQDVIGAIETADGPLDIVMDHVDVGAGSRVWLFARATVDAMPAVYEEIGLVSVDRFLPEVLTRNHIAGIRLSAWLACVVVIPLLYRAMGFLSLLLAPAKAIWRRRKGLPAQRAARTPGPIRLLLIALTIQGLLVVVSLPLFERLFWAMTARFLTTAAIAWLALLLIGLVERYLQRRLTGGQSGEVVGILRLGRRTADLLVVVAGALVVLSYFGIDLTAALAGLGIGGIAVALAAQKTLENVIGGISIIFDKAVSVGDFLKVGDTVGTVEEIGLRSTRIRTLDRTVLTVPNSMIAGVNLETISARDKFWFHHQLALPVTTAAPQLRSIVGDLGARLREEPHVDIESVRARVIRFGPSSIDVELFAYLFAPSWEVFLELQETLLLDALDIVERRGAAIAPAHTVHVAAVSGLPGTLRGHPAAIP